MGGGGEGANSLELLQPQLLSKRARRGRGALMALESSIFRQGISAVWEIVAIRDKPPAPDSERCVGGVAREEDRRTAKRIMVRSCSQS